jgi:Flp pilus assembly protein TadD
LSPRTGFRFAGAALAIATIASLTGCAHLVLLHDPLNASEHNDLGVAYESAGQLDLAAKEYRHALQLDPHRSQTRVNLGNVKSAQGSWRDAEKCYRRALADSSTNADAMNNLAMALLTQNRRLDEAASLAERAVATGGERDSIYRETLAEVQAGRANRP